MASFSAGSGIVLGGLVVDEFGWRSIFWFSASHAAVALVCVAVVLPASTRRAAAQQLDVLGGVLLAPAVAALLWAITRLKGSGVNDPVTQGLALVGLVALVLWVRASGITRVR